MCVRILLLFLVALCGCKNYRENEWKYAIGRDPSWYPLQQLGYTAVELIGFTNALIAEIAKEERVPLQIVDVNWSSLSQGLEEKKYAAIFSSLSPNYISENQYSFSDPIICLGPVLIVPINSQIRALDDLSGKIVGVSQFNDSVGIVQKYPSIIINQYQNIPDALDDLVTGKIDAVLLAELQALDLIPSQYANTLKIVSDPLNEKALRILTQKNSNQNLIKHINIGLQKLKSSGRYSELRKQFELS